MIIQLQPQQVVEVWPGIKEGVEAVGRVISTDPIVVTNVLASLLSGKFQLWLMLNEAREIQAFIITSLEVDTLTQENFLHVDMVYGFAHSEDELFQEACAKLCEFALAYNCDYIKATTAVARAEEIILMLGGKEISKNFILRVK